MKISGDEVSGVDRLKYLRFVLQMNGSIKKDMNHRSSCGWMRQKETSGIFCDKNNLIMLKCKFYKVIMKPDIMCGLEC